MQMPKTAGFNRFCLHVEGFQLTLIFQCVFCLQTMATDPQNKPKDPVSKSRRSRLDEPIAPDGGWGWVILFASFLSAVIVDGVCFSFGIFYLEFLSYYQENKGKTAWIGSVLNGTYMIMGKWTSIQSAWRGHNIRAASRFAPSQWETALLRNDVSHWLDANLEAAPWYMETLSASPGTYITEISAITGHLMMTLSAFMAALRGIHRSPVDYRYKGPVTHSFDVPFDARWINGWTPKGSAVQLRRIDVFNVSTKKLLNKHAHSMIRWLP